MATLYINFHEVCHVCQFTDILYKFNLKDFNGIDFYKNIRERKIYYRQDDQIKKMTEFKGIEWSGPDITFAT
jgi:hypothetical protein